VRETSVINSQETWSSLAGVVVAGAKVVSLFVLTLPL
jgi:hypothetical protein